MIETTPRPLVITWPMGELVRENWGDKLNPHLVELLSGRPVVNEKTALDVPDGAAIYSVIGSHLSRMTPRHVVWGTGFIAEADRLRQTPRQICAVRGPLSRAKLLALGIDCPAVYGDPAALYPLFYRPDPPKSHDLGLILHVRDRGIAQVPPAPAGLAVKEIDINGGLETVVDEIAPCRAVASSSLHGIIAAHAYGVPAVWITFGDRLVGDGLKFRDYLASVGIADARPVPMDSGTTCALLIAAASLPRHPLDLNALIDSCPFIDEARKADLRQLAQRLTR